MHSANGMVHIYAQGEIYLLPLPLLFPFMINCYWQNG